MKPTNLLIIGGAVVLGGIYLADKRTKAKAKAKADMDVKMLALANAELQAEIQKNKLLFDTKTNTNFVGITPQECAKLGKKYKKVAVYCTAPPCPDFGICE
jgi:hypothetical protein